MEPRELAYEDWASGMKYQEIADKYGVSLSAVKSWAARDWKQRKVATKNKGKLQPRAKKLQPQKGDGRAAPSVAEQLISAVEENEELPEQQKQFCLFYLTNFNATQAYLKAYGCTYAVANTNGWRLLVNTRIKKEIAELKKIKNAALGGLCGDDVVELHMRIAFANMTDIVSFGNYTRPVFNNGKPVMFTNPKTGEKKILTEQVNEVTLVDSGLVDGQIINSVSEGRDGVKVQLADRQRSMAFLERYFTLNPMDRHRMEYDNRRYDLEKKKADEKSADGGLDTLSVKDILISVRQVAEHEYKNRAQPETD